MHRLSNKHTNVLIDVCICTQTYVIKKKRKWKQNRSSELYVITDYDIDRSRSHVQKKTTNI